VSAHLRTEIRDAVTALLAGAPLAGTRVYANRRFPLEPDKLPALLVYTMSEDSSVETMTPPRFLSRDLDLVVEAVAQDNLQLDAVLDQLADAIEVRMGAAINDVAGPLRQLVRAGSLVRTEVGFRPPAQPDEAGTGHIVLTFRVNYRTRFDNPKLNT
jgi:hypothetical protein